MTKNFEHFIPYYFCFLCCCFLKLLLSGMANSVDPDQTAPSGAVWSGSALFACVILSDTLVFEILGHLPYGKEFRCVKFHSKYGT